MKVSHVESVASYNGLESCGATRKDGVEALTEERAGWVLSRGTSRKRKEADVFSGMSSRQGCGSSGVRVLTPSITCIRRLAYSVRAEATKHVQPERKSLGCPVR